MKVAILGSGVIGVTTAWYLAEAGHEVHVYDRQPESGLETSFANAGQVSPGYSSPWAAPGIPLKVARWLLMKYSPFVIRPSLDPALWRWLVQMLANCSGPAYARNKERMVRLAEYSRDKLDELRESTGITYDDRQQGTLQLFRNEKQIAASQQDIAVLRSFGVPYEELDVAGCVAVEPGLGRVAHKLAGGLRLPGDETGDACLFTQRLASMAAEKGVRFHYGVEILELEREGMRLSGVMTNCGRISGEAYVLALASYSPALAKGLGLRLPIYPVKGYSLTADLLDEAHAPRSTIMDETYKIGITRFEKRLRIGGTAELAGFDTSLRLARRAPLEHSMTDLFPGVGDLQRARFWAGLRPMTPDGTPIIGPSPLRNLYLNTGHGTLGWTMACGSARIVSDQISGKTPEIASADLAFARY